MDLALEIIGRGLETQSKELKEADLKQYLSILKKIFLKTMLDEDYISSDQLTNLIDYYGKAVLYEMKDSLEIDTASGFPIRREFREAHTKKEDAQRRLETLPKMDLLIEDITRKMLACRKKDLEKNFLERETELYKLLSISEQLQSDMPHQLHLDADILEKEKRYLSLTYLLEGLDVTKNLFLKYTIDLEYNKSLVSKPVIDIKTGIPKGKLLTFLRDAYFAESDVFFENLKQFKGVTPKRVCRTIIGPFFTRYTDIKPVVVEDGHHLQAIARKHDSYIIAFPKDDTREDYTPGNEKGYVTRQSPLFVCEKKILNDVKKTVPSISRIMTI
jgi:hypothetical protein